MADTPLPVSLAGMPGRWTLTDAGWVVSQEGANPVVSHLTSIDILTIATVANALEQTQLLNQILTELRAMRLGLMLLTETDLFEEAKGLAP